MNATYNNRNYSLTIEDQNLDGLKSDLISRGFDGNVYYGISKPEGRQRSTKTAMFYRNAKTGAFTFAA